MWGLAGLFGSHQLTMNYLWVAQVETMPQGRSYPEDYCLAGQEAIILLGCHFGMSQTLVNL